MSDTPQVTRVYQNHHLDSTRWEVYEPRPDDTIVATSYKSGTTWASRILHLILNAHLDPIPDRPGHWPDARFMGTSKKDLAKALAEDPGPRELKTHLPLDGMPYFPELRYVVVARDPRDVFMSLLNHYGSYTDLAYGALNSPDKVGEDLPPCPDDPRALWREWTSRGWFEWESEGWPFWSNLHHTQSYWEWRHLPNFLFLHYNDMLADLPAAVRTLASFVGVELDEARVAWIAEQTTFASMKKEAVEASEQSDPNLEFWRGGQKTFIHKGTNGRWRSVLTAGDLELLDAAKKRVLSPECAAWLENGGALLP